MYLPSGHRKEVRCGFCAETGHRRDSCRHGKALRCNTCKGMGHKAKFCLQYHGNEEVARLILERQDTADDIFTIERQQRPSRREHTTSIENKDIQLEEL